MDACLIAAGQRTEHYEIAAYGTLVAWVRDMGHADAEKLLQETLDEEKAADEKLTSIAESGINQDAADARIPQMTKTRMTRRPRTRDEADRQRRSRNGRGGGEEAVIRRAATW